MFHMFLLMLTKQAYSISRTRRLKLTIAKILTVLFIGSEFWQLGFTQCFSWELNIPKLLVAEEVGGTNFHGLIFLWAREDEIFVNIILGNDKDDWKQKFKQT